MGDRVDFILQIILRLKDEASTKLAAIRTQLDGLNKDAAATTVGFDSMNSSITSMTRRLGNLKNRIGEVKTVIGDLGDEDEDLAKLASTVDKINTALGKVPAKRKVQVEIEEVPGEPTLPQAPTERPRGGRERLDAKARLAEQQARVAEQEAQLANEEALAALNRARQQAAREGRVFEEPKPAPPEREQRTVNIDELFRIERQLNEAGKRRILVINNETDEIVVDIADRKTQRSSRRAANAALGRAARDYLLAQAKAAEEAGKEAEAAEDKAEADKQAAKDARNAARRKKRADDKAAAAAEEEAEVVEESATVKKEEVEKAREKFPEAEKEIEGLKELNDAQRKHVDALDGQIVQIKFSTDYLGRNIVKVVNRLDDGVSQFGRSLNEAGEAIKGTEFESRFDPSVLRKPGLPPIGGGAQGAGDFDDFEDQFARFVEGLGEIRPRLEKEIQDIRNLFREEPIFDVESVRQVSGAEDLLRAEQLRERAARMRDEALTAGRATPADIAMTESRISALQAQQQQTTAKIADLTERGFAPDRPEFTQLQHRLVDLEQAIDELRITLAGDSDQREALRLGAESLEGEAEVLEHGVEGLIERIQENTAALEEAEERRRGIAREDPLLAGGEIHSALAEWDQHIRELQDRQEELVDAIIDLDLDDAFEELDRREREITDRLEELTPLMQQPPDVPVEPELVDEWNALTQRLEGIRDDDLERALRRELADDALVQELIELRTTEEGVTEALREAFERRDITQQTLRGEGIDPRLDFLIRDLTDSIAKDRNAIFEFAEEVKDQLISDIQDRFGAGEAGPPTAITSASEEDIRAIRMAAESIEEEGVELDNDVMIAEANRLRVLAERLELGESGLVQRIEELKQSLDIMRESQRAIRPSDVIDEDIIDAQNRLTELMGESNAIYERLIEQQKEGLLTNEDLHRAVNDLNERFGPDIVDLQEAIEEMTGIVEDQDLADHIDFLTHEIELLEGQLKEQRLAQIEQATMLSEFEAPRRPLRESEATRQEFAPQFEDIGLESLAARIDENTRALEALETVLIEETQKTLPTTNQLEAFEVERRRLGDLEESISDQIRVMEELQSEGEDVEAALLALIDQLGQNDQAIDDMSTAMREEQARRVAETGVDFEGINRKIADLQQAIEDDRRAVLDNTDAIRKQEGGGGLPPIGGGAPGAGSFEDDFSKLFESFGKTTDSEILRMRGRAADLQKEVDKVDREFERVNEEVREFAEGFGDNADFIQEVISRIRFRLKEGDISREGIEGEVMESLPRAPTEAIVDIADEIRRIFHEGIDPRALIKEMGFTEEGVEFDIGTKDLTDKIRALNRSADALDLGLNGLTERFQRNSEILEVIFQRLEAAHIVAEEEERAAIEAGVSIPEEGRDEVERLTLQARALRTAIEDDERAIREHATKIDIDAEGLAAHFRLLDLDADRLRALQTFGQRILVAIERIDAAGQKVSEVLHGQFLTERLDQAIAERGGPGTIGGGAQGAGGGRKPPTPPPTAAAGGDSEEERDFERRYQRNLKTVKSLTSQFEITESNLTSLIRRFREGSVDEEKFFSISDELRKTLEKIAKSAPVDWSTKAAEEFFDKARQIRLELQDLSKLRQIFGDNEEFRVAVRAFNAIKVSLDDVGNAIDVTRGGMQIFRRENERMRELGVAGLLDEIEETQNKFHELNAQATAAELRGTSISKTAQRELQRIGSRISAQREVLRQLLELEVEAQREGRRAAAPGAPVEEEDTETTEKQTEATKELIARALELRDTMNRVHRDLANRRIDRTTAIGDFDELGRQLANLSRIKGLDALSGTARQLRGLTRQAKEAAQALRDQDKLADATSKTTRAQEEQEEEVEALAARFEALDRQVEEGGLSAREASIHFSRFTRELNRVSNAADVGSDKALRFGLLAQRSAERSRRAFADLSAEVGGTSNIFNQMANAINRVTLRANALGSNVSKIDNQLRGLAVLGVIVFAQQLLTALIGLGGALVSVGSSAAFAAGAIGGTLVSGIAQALPMVGLLVAALGQVGAVSDAINQADLVKQQQFGRQQQQRQAEAAGGGEALDRANRLANANDGLKAAQDRVGDGQRRLSDANRGLADAQKELTQARQEARDNLEELIQAEREAELAARGAALSQQEAQERLAEAVRGGDLLSLQRAELGVLEAGQGRVTARRDLREARADVAAGRDIERTPEVQAATRQVEDAKRQIDDAKRGIDDADRAVGRARRGLQAAKVDAAQAGAETFAAADKLEFLLKEMTPAQRRLYNALVQIRKDFDRVFTPITDIIIDSFTRGVNTADKILKSAIFLRTARDQATELAAAFDRVRIHFFEDDEKLRQIFDIMRDGTDNIRPLSRIFENVGDALLNIAQDAGPAFEGIIDWFEDLSRDIKGITENHDAMEDFFGLAAKHATSWLDLVKNVGIFLAVLAGQGEAEGFTLLEDFNDAVVNATEWLREHEEEVRIFFHDVGEVTRSIGGLIVEVAKAILDVFNPERTRTLITFIENELLPALVFVVNKVGAWVDIFLKFLDLPIVGDLTKAMIAITLIGGVITGASGALIFFGLQIGHFFAILGRVLGIFGRINPVIGKFVGFLATIVSKIPLLRPLAGVLTTIATGLGVGGAARAGAATRTTSVVDDLVDFAAGPSATTPGGRRVTTQRRPGLLGKLGLKKVIVEETDDVVKAADDLAVKGGAKFGAGFLAKAGSFVKLGAWTTIGIGAVNGIMTGIRTGNIKSGITDFMHTISFGITKSTEEIADEAINKIEERLKQRRPIPPPITEREVEAATPRRRPTTPGVRGSVIGETTFDIGTGGATTEERKVNVEVTGLTEAEKDAEELKKWLDDIKDANPDMAKAAETMVDMFRRVAIARREKAGEGIFQGMLAELRALARRFPGLAPLANEAADGIKKAMERVDKFLKPRQIAVKFAFDILDLKEKPKQFQKKIDELIAETDRLTPAGRRSVKRTIEAMVSEFVARGHLTVDEAINLRAKVNKQWDNATEDAREKSKKTARAAARNMLLAQRVVAAGSATMGEDSAAVFNAISLGEVKAGPLTRTAARIKQKWTGGGDPLASLRAGGGIIGMKGESGRDLIPAVLGRGEMVFNKFHQRYVQPAIQAYYGHNLEDVFKRIRGQHAGPISPFGFSGGYAGKAPGGNKTVPIPSQYTTGTPEFIAQSVLRAAVGLLRGYKMVVTDAFATSGHESPGHLVTGTAMDTIPGPRGNWDLVNKAVGAATAKGVRVLYDGRFGSEAYPDHGEGLHAHFELGSAIGKMFAKLGIPKLPTMDYPWPLEGVHKKTGQAIFDRIRKHANDTIERLVNKYGFIETGGDYAPGSDAGIGADRAASIFRQAFRIAGVPMLPGFLSNLVNLATEESTLNPAAQNLTPAGVAAGYPEGILQVTRGTFQAYKLRGYDNPFNALHNAIASILYQMARYGTIVRHAPYSFGGIVGEYAEGGEIPGHQGQPRPILAHGREWVLNLAQQAQVAAMTGLSRESLKSMLGFHGGPTSFQGGGDTGEGPSVAQQRSRLNLSFTTEAEIDRIRDVLRGIFRLPAIPVIAWKDVVEEAHRALQAIAVVGQRTATRVRNLNRLIQRLRRGGVTAGEEDDIKRAIDERERLQKLGGVRRQIRRIQRGGVTEREEPRLERLEAREIRLESPDRRRFLQSVNNITKDGGILDQMDEARSRRTQDMTDGLTRMTLRLRRKIAGGADIDIDMRVVDRELDNARKELKDITTERGVIVKTLKRVNNRLKDLQKGGVSAGESEDFVKASNRLKQLRKGGVTDEEKEEVKRLNNRIKALQKGGVSEGEAAEVRALTQQQANLREDFRAIRTAQVEALNKVFEARRARVQAMIDKINQEAEDREFGLGLRERLAETFGNTGALAQIANERVGSIQSQIAGLQSQLPRAQRLGDTEMIRSLTQQIGDLQTSIVEIINQQMVAMQEAINDVASRRLGRLDLFERMATAIGAVGLGGGATVGGQTLTRAGVFQQRGEALGQQRSQLQDLLAAVVANPVTAQNQQLIQDLTDQIVELDVTIAENTAAAFAARVEDVNRVAGFATGILDLRQRIVELTGQISSTDTADQVKALLREREGVLATQRRGLEALLAEAQAAGNQAAIEDLTTQLLQNEVATLENTLAIDQLVNKDNLQTFSTSAWTQFRNAIFDGLGNLLPKYAVTVPSAQAGARIMQSGLIQAHSGEVVVPAAIVRSRSHGMSGTEINTEVQITNPTEVADPVYLGNAIGWRIANNPNLRP